MSNTSYRNINNKIVIFPPFFLLCLLFCTMTYFEMHIPVLKLQFNIIVPSVPSYGSSLFHLYLS
jgi:hypothetical protein